MQAGALQQKPKPGATEAVYHALQIKRGQRQSGVKGKDCCVEINKQAKTARKCLIPQNNFKCHRLP